MFQAVASRRGLVAIGSHCLKSKPAHVNTAVRAFAASGGGEGYLKRQEKLGRPVSPHVTIYAFPLAAISSVTHRITGGMLTIGLYGMGYAALVGVDVPALASTLGSSSMGPLLKLSVAAPLLFHFAGGVRHFYWERYPEGLNAQTQYQSAAALFAVTGAGGLLAMAL